MINRETATRHNTKICVSFDLEMILTFATFFLDSLLFFSALILDGESIFDGLVTFNLKELKLTSLNFQIRNPHELTFDVHLFNVKHTWTYLWCISFLLLLSLARFLKSGSFPSNLPLSTLLMIITTIEKRYLSSQIIHDRHILSRLLLFSIFAFW